MTGGARVNSAVSTLCAKSLLHRATKWAFPEGCYPHGCSCSQTPPCRMQVPAVFRGCSLCRRRTTMPRLLRLLTLVALVALVLASGARVARTSAEMSTPTAGAGNAPLILIEHADLVSEIDLGEPGVSVGDMLVWGPNTLYDDAQWQRHRRHHAGDLYRVHRKLRLPGGRDDPLPGRQHPRIPGD